MWIEWLAHGFSGCGSCDCDSPAPINLLLQTRACLAQVRQLELQSDMGLESNEPKGWERIRPEGLEINKSQRFDGVHLHDVYELMRSLCSKEKRRLVFGNELAP